MMQYDATRCYYDMAGANAWRRFYVTFPFPLSLKQHVNCVWTVVQWTRSVMVMSCYEFCLHLYQRAPDLYEGTTLLTLYQIILYDTVGDDVMQHQRTVHFTTRYNMSKVRNDKTLQYHNLIKQLYNMACHDIRHKPIPHNMTRYGSKLNNIRQTLQLVSIERHTS